MPIVGKVERSHRWPEKDVQGGLSQEELDTRAWEIKDEVQKRVIRTKLGPQHRTIWESTLEEVKAGL